MTSENINIGMCNVYFDTVNSRGLRKLGPQHSCNYNNSNNNNHKKRETNEKKNGEQVEQNTEQMVQRLMPLL